MRPSQELRDLGKQPQKKLGQNFLTDQKVISDMVAAGKVTSEDIIVEIGPGLGALTFELAKIAKKVIAIEQDRELAEDLRQKIPNNVIVVTGDALQIDWTIDIESNYKIIANIPYSLTSPLLRKIFVLEKKPSLVILLIQREMAERLTAKPGNSERGFLTLLTESNAETRIVRSVKPGSFYPAPKVESAIIEVVLLEKPRQETIFWPVVEAGFRHKRQTLINALNKDLKISKAELTTIFSQLGFDPLVRAQVLKFEDWQQLSKAIKL